LALIASGSVINNNELVYYSLDTFFVDWHIRNFPYQRGDY